jgi:hypothetical protein
VRAMGLGCWPPWSARLSCSWKEMCRGLIADLGTGKLSGRLPELPELGTAAHDLATTVEEARQQAF